MSRQQGVIHVQAVSDELRLCRVRRTRAGVEVSDAVQIRAARQVDDVSVLSDESAVRALIDTVRQRRWTGLDAYCLLGGASVACQYYEIPPLKGAALRQAVELKLGQQLHFSVADALVAIEPPVAAADKSTGQVLVGATAVVSELARTAVKTLRDAGLNPIGLTAVPAALTALAHATHGGEGGFSGIFFIDERHSTFILFKNGLPVVSTDITFGAGDLTTALMRPIIAGDDVVQLDAAQALALRNQVGIPTAAQKIDSINVTGERLLPLLEPVLQRLAKQLTQWLTFAGAKSTSSSVLLRVVGPGGRHPSPGEQGEILVRGPGVMAGYLQGGTPDDVVEGWLRTGDLGSFDDDGYLTILDRLKDMIRSGGENVASSEIETVVYEVEGVHEAAVIGVPHPKWVEVPAVLVGPAPGHEVDPEALIAHCRARLGGFKVPKAVYLVDDLPRNLTGKVLKRELRDDVAGLTPAWVAD